MIHPARALSFDDLYSGLLADVAAGFVSENVGEDGLRIYCYTKRTVYEKAWDTITLLARGLILDVERRRIAATPFPKFFNVGERDGVLPALPFETFEKVDGSLIIIFWHRGRWRTATKGSFRSDQALWAQRQLDAAPTFVLNEEVTYLAEAVYPENRIVVPYDESGLVMLAAYDDAGYELSAGTVEFAAKAAGWRMAKRHQFASVADLVAQAETLPATAEGFVIRYEDGTRLKVKGDEYRRLHAMVSRCTPLAVWESMMAGDNLDLIRRELPEEFWEDFDCICNCLVERMVPIVREVKAAAEKYADHSDKELGLKLGGLTPQVRKLIFPFRQQNGELLHSRAKESLLRMVRPTANRLDGYEASRSMNRVMDEAA